MNQFRTRVLAMTAVVGMCLVLLGGALATVALRSVATDSARVAGVIWDGVSPAGAATDGGRVAGIIWDGVGPAGASPDGNHWG